MAQFGRECEKDYMDMQLAPVADSWSQRIHFQGRMNPSMGLDWRHPGARHPCNGPSGLSLFDDLSEVHNQKRLSVEGLKKRFQPAPRISAATALAKSAPASML